MNKILSRDEIYAEVEKEEQRHEKFLIDFNTLLRKKHYGILATRLSIEDVQSIAKSEILPEKFEHIDLINRTIGIYFPEKDLRNNIVEYKMRQLHYSGE